MAGRVQRRRWGGRRRECRNLESTFPSKVSQHGVGLRPRGGSKVKEKVTPVKGGRGKDWLGSEGDEEFFTERNFLTALRAT